MSDTIKVYNSFDGTVLCHSGMTEARARDAHDFTRISGNGNCLLQKTAIIRPTEFLQVATVAVMLSLLWAGRTEAQGIAQGVSPPASAKTTKCQDRKIPQLEDVTKNAGIQFSHSSAPEARYIIESMSGGVLLLDYDRDGWLDIFFTNAPTVDGLRKGQTAHGALYRNNHDGTFTDVTEKAGVGKPCFGMGGAVGDINNDGWPDIYLTCHGGNILYRNNGDGTFTDVTKAAGVADGRWSTGATFGDYDGDGFVDLMVTNYVEFDMEHRPVFGKGSTCKYMGIDVQCGPRGLKGQGDSLFHNNGDGTFADVSKKTGLDDAYGFYGLSAVWVDFNNTGRPDLYVANDSNAAYLYRNDGGGKFTEIAPEAGVAFGEDGHEQAAMGIAIGDYLHTGRPSIAISDFSDDNTPLYRNDGNWQFEDVSYASGIGLPSVPLVKWGIAFVDLDNDGWLDLFTVTGHVYPQVDSLGIRTKYREPKLVQYNQGDGTFCDASDQSGAAMLEPRVSRGLAVGDLFNDGNIDLVVEDLQGSPMVLRNPGLPGRHWVSFELAGTKSNKLALGARLKIVSGGVTQTSQILSGGSYLSQNDLRVHFGLGSTTKIDGLEIRWPSGQIETLKDLDADKFYSVLEGKGIVPAEQIRPKMPGKGGKP
jgi:enediyne biosynthesis protein E4